MFYYNITKHLGALSAFLLCFIILMYGPCRASEPINLISGVDFFNIPGHMDYMEDPGGQLTIRDASRPEYANLFKPYVGDDEFNIGHSRSVIWIRFKLAPDGDATAYTEWLFEFGKPGIGEIDLYIPESENGWLVKKTGANRPESSKEAAHRTFVLSVPTGYNPDRYFYVRLKSSISINLSMRLWRPAAFTWLSSYDYYGFGILYGIMIAMIIYNLAVYAFLADRTYLYYVIYATSVLVYMSMLFGHLPSYVQLPLLGRTMYVWVILGVTWLSIAAFCRAFLNTRAITPILDKLIISVMFLGMAMIVLAAIKLDFWANMLNSALTPIACILAITAGFRAWHKGFQPAKYYLLAWLMIMIGSTLYTLGGVLIPRTFLTRYTIAMAIPLETLILSLSLAARIKALRKEKDDLTRSADRLRRLSETDGLTSLFNKRYMMERLGVLVDESHLTGQPLTLAMMDVDDFKIYNDTYGHPAGDEVLRALAKLVKASARGGDCACRYGGEEFSLILPGASGPNAVEVAERIRRAFFDVSFTPNPGQKIRVTVSLGLAELLPGESMADLIRRADKALYRAKKLGKNRTVSF